MRLVLNAAKYLGWSLLAVLVVHIVAVLLFLPAANRWGATPAEQNMTLPGDELIDPILAADRIHPEWQVKVGDDVVLHPAGLKMPVTALEPGRSLILADGSWSFHLVPQADGSTRLVARSRGTSGGAPAWANRFIIRPIAFLMEQKMLRGIRDRAEG